MESVKYINVKGFDFIIVDEVNYNNNHYLLAIDEAGEDTIAILRQSMVDGSEMVESVTDEDELQAVLNILNSKGN